MSVLAEGVDATLPQTRRVLIYRLGSLGDMCIALPALNLVERTFPLAERRLLTNFPVSSKAPAARMILEGTGLIHSYERYSAGTRSMWQLLALVWRIRRFRPDVLVYLVAARGVPVAERDRRFFKTVCGIGRVVGVPLTEDMQSNLTTPDGMLEPEAARLTRNLAVLGDAGLDRAENWSLRLSPTELQRAAAALKPMQRSRYMAVSVGTKVQAKDWGRDNWRALLARLAAECAGYSLVLMGAAEEWDTSDFAAEGWRSQPGAGTVLNLCGKLAPRESAAALQAAVLFLGHDSGPMHMAAAVGTPCVAIFAARNIPRVWFPFGTGHRVLYHQVDCWGCELETCTEQRRKCLLSITVEEVVSAVRDTLQQREYAAP